MNPQPGTMGWGHGVGPWRGTMAWDHGVGPWDGTMAWMKHIYPRVIQYQRIHKRYTFDNFFRIAIFANRVSPSPCYETFMLSTRWHICATMLFKWIKIRYLKIGDFILLEINEYNNRQICRFLNILQVKKNICNFTETITPQQSSLHFAN